MARLTARIVRLERRLPTGLKAELVAMSDEELKRRIEAALRQMSEEDVRAMAREYPGFFTAEVLEEELERWRELQGGGVGDCFQAKAMRDKDRDRP